MPAVCRPSWATSIPLLQCIIHEPPNSAEDSPGDSRAQQCRTAQGGEDIVREACSTFVRGEVTDLRYRVSWGFCDLRVTRRTHCLSAGIFQLLVFLSKACMLLIFFFPPSPPLLIFWKTTVVSSKTNLDVYLLFADNSIAMHSITCGVSTWLLLVKTN